MKHAFFKKWAWWACAFGMGGLAAGAQVAAPPANRPTSTPPTPVVTVPVPVSPLDSLFAQLIQQGASDAVVMVDAEFDPPVIELGKSSLYRVVITAQQEACALPEKMPFPPGLEFAASGEGMSYAAVNQSIQYRTTFNFRVKANQAGTYAMPAFTVKANGKPVAVPPRSLSVAAPGSGVDSSPARLLAELPPGNIYIGQSVPLRFVVPDLANEGWMAITQTKVEGDAFIFDKIAGRQRREVRSYEGKPVPTLIDEMMAIPVKEGRHQVILHAFVIGSRKPDPRMISLPSYYPLLDSDPVEITVKHLPAEGELPGFTGLVGAFQVDRPLVSTNQVHAGDPVILSVTVRGDGNLPRLVPPKPGPMPGWQIMLPTPDPTPPTLLQLRGSNVFSYLLIPLSTNQQATPALPFCYFNPQKEAYFDLTIPSVPIQVLPPLATGIKTGHAQESETQLEKSGAQPKAAPEAIQSRLPKRGSYFAERAVPLQEKAWFLILQLLVGGGLLGLWAWDRRRRFLALHPGIVRLRRARRGLRREWRRLRRAAARQDAAGFVRAAVNALREGSAPRAEALPGALVCADVLEALAPEEREGETGRMVRQLFSLSDAVTFRNKAPEWPALAHYQPQLLLLLENMRRRL